MGYRLVWNRRPDINEQNTGHEAFQRPMGLSRVPFAGGAGFIAGSLAATYPGTIVPGNSLKKNNAFVTGNPNTNVQLQPLSNEDPLSNYGQRNL